MTSFTLLYERYLESIYRYVAARLATREEAEDVTSEAFRRAWSSRGAYRASGTFRAWVFRIVRRTLADHYRRAQPVARLAQAVADLLPDEQPTPEECVERNEQQQHARQLLTGLTAEQQEILWSPLRGRAVLCGHRPRAWQARRRCQEDRLSALESIRRGQFV